MKNNEKILKPMTIWINGDNEIQKPVETKSRNKKANKKETKNEEA